jgi:hypothetical protein
LRDAELAFELLEMSVGAMRCGKHLIIRPAAFWTIRRRSSGQRRTVAQFPDRKEGS